MMQSWVACMKLNDAMGFTKEKDEKPSKPKKTVHE